MGDAIGWDEAFRIDDAFGDDAAVWLSQCIAIQLLADNHPQVRRFDDLAGRVQRIRRSRSERLN